MHSTLFFDQLWLSSRLLACAREVSALQSADVKSETGCDRFLPSSFTFTSLSHNAGHKITLAVDTAPHCIITTYK